MHGSPEGMRRLACILCGAIYIAAPAGATSLKEAYDLAGPAGDYDKYVVLETGVTYTGGLWIGRTYNRISAQFDGRGESVRIVGNGAMLDLQGGEVCIAYCSNRLDIDDCVVVHGDIKFRGYDGGGLDYIPEGSVRYITFYQPHDYGVRMFLSGAGVLSERNIVVDAVDTGWDFMFLTGLPNSWLPTGASFSASVQGGWNLYDNWTYHTDPLANADLLRHFSLLCDYG